VRRAKLYYLRELRGKKAKIKEKRDTLPVKGSAAPKDDVAPALDPVLESNEPAAADVTGELTEA
jgi:hypothetical protein